jgi:hypothetical protein
MGEAKIAQSKESQGYRKISGLYSEEGAFIAN